MLVTMRMSTRPAMLFASFGLAALGLGAIALFSGDSSDRLSELSSVSPLRSAALGRALADVEEKEKPQKRQRIVGFWHIGSKAIGPKGGNTSRDEFVQKQWNEIRSTPLFADHEKKKDDYDLELRWVARGVELNNETREILAKDGRVVEHPATHMEFEDGEEYFEFPTLVELHAHCREDDHADDVVFYMHTKTKDDYRNFFQDQMLGPQCFDDCLLRDPTKVACGPNAILNAWEKGFWFHFSGNFWATRCSHIRKLNTPFYPEVMDEFKMFPSGGRVYHVRPLGRYFAEYWVLNDKLGPRPEPSEGRAKNDLVTVDEVCSNTVEGGKWRGQKFVDFEKPKA